MKNENIHDVFEDKEIRDFLAKSLKECGFHSSAKHIENKIKLLQKELVKAKQFEGIVQLIRKQGWTEFDVSDEIEDYVAGTYFSFLGTQEEMKQINFGVK